MIDEKVFNALEKVLAELPEKGHLLTLHEYALDDRILLHKMIFRFLDFSYAETVYLLQGLIIYQQRWGELNEMAKEGIREVCTVLMRRAREYQQSGELVKATELAFAVLVTVEPDQEPDDLLYYAIVADAVVFISELVKEVTDKNLAQQLYEMIIAYYKQWRPSCSDMKQYGKTWLRILGRQFFEL